MLKNLEGKEYRNLNSVYNHRYLFPFLISEKLLPLLTPASKYVGKEVRFGNFIFVVYQQGQIFKTCQLFVPHGPVKFSGLFGEF